MDKVKQMGRKEEICHILAVRFRKLLDFSSIDFSKLQEIRLRVGAPFLIVYGGKEFFLDSAGRFTSEADKAFVVGQREIRETLEYISKIGRAHV